MLLQNLACVPCTITQCVTWLALCMITRTVLSVLDYQRNRYRSVNSLSSMALERAFSSEHLLTLTLFSSMNLLEFILFTKMLFAYSLEIKIKQMYELYTALPTHPSCSTFYMWGSANPTNHKTCFTF